MYGIYVFFFVSKLTCYKTASQINNVRRESQWQKRKKLRGNKLGKVQLRKKAVMGRDCGQVKPRGTKGGGGGNSEKIPCGTFGTCLEISKQTFHAANTVSMS